jgi:hypothetical protein
MFYQIAKEWVEELRKQNKCNADAMEELTREYAKRLEEIFNQEAKKQLERLNKAEEFERMLLWDTQYLSKYLNQTIPAFYSFRDEIIKKAKKIILNE